MSNYLFHPGDLVATLETLRRKIGSEIEKLPEDYVLKVNEAEYVKRRVADETIYPLSIESGVEVIRDFEVERERQGRVTRYTDRTPAIEVSLRFSGERKLFEMRQNPFNEPPEGQVYGDEIRATFEIDKTAPPETTRSRIDRWEQRIRRHVDEQRPHLDAWNNQLEELVSNHLRTTKERFLKKSALVASIGLPIRRRAETGGTYVVGVPRKQVRISPSPMPTVPPGQYVPHPALDEKCYQDILGSIRWMGKTMERDPAAYSKMFEEHLRSHFLASLNGSFEGQGSGETFSVQGKTDIFLRVDDRAVFIAECKYWDGPSTFPQIIDQLTGYLTWRESKAAVLLFVANQDISPVLAQIPGLAEAHRLYTKRERTDHSGEFRFVFRNSQDESLPLVITVLCFHLPGTAHKRGTRP